MASAAMRLNSMHTTSCAVERNWSLLDQLCTKAGHRLAIEREDKLVFVKQNSPDEVLPVEDAMEDWEIFMALLGTRSRQGWQLDGA
jgi:transcription initiation factor IIF auxiliary subunit